MVEYLFIGVEHELYAAERELRFRALARPAGLDAVEVFPFEADSLHLLALERGEAAGCVLFHPEDRGGGRLYQMAVAEERRGRGIGSGLAQRLEAELIRRGFAAITLHARENAVGFYQRLGFRCYGDPFVEVGIPHRHMRKLFEPGCAEV